MENRRPVLFFLLFACATALSAQAYSGTGRNPSRFNPILKALKVGSVIKSLDDSGTGTFNHWCSSFLLPDAPKPVKTADMDEFLRDYQRALDDWSCQYSPERLTDGNPATAWAEAAPGDGVGEAVIVRVDLTKPLRVWAGFGHSEDYHKKNARPRRIQVTVLRAARADPHQFGTVYQEIRAIAQGEVELADKNGYQPLGLPAFSADEGMAELGFVAIKILSVYPGSKYKDCLISEVSN